MVYAVFLSVDRPGKRTKPREDTLKYETERINVYALDLQRWRKKKPDKIETNENEGENAQKCILSFGALRSILWWSTEHVSRSQPLESFTNSLISVAMHQSLKVK